MAFVNVLLAVVASGEENFHPGQWVTSLDLDYQICLVTEHTVEFCPDDDSLPKDAMKSAIAHVVTPAFRRGQWAQYTDGSHAGDFQVGSVCVDSVQFFLDNGNLGAEKIAIARLQHVEVPNFKIGDRIFGIGVSAAAQAEAKVCGIAYPLAEVCASAGAAVNAAVNVGHLGHSSHIPEPTYIPESTHHDDYGSIVAETAITESTTTTTSTTTTMSTTTYTTTTYLAASTSTDSETTFIGVLVASAIICGVLCVGVCWTCRAVKKNKLDTASSDGSSTFRSQGESSGRKLREHRGRPHE